MSTATLELETRLDLRAVGPLRAAILSHRGGDLVLDADRVDYLGALALQTIRAAAQTWAADGHGLRLANVSDRVADQLALFGFTARTATEWEAEG